MVAKFELILMIFESLSETKCHIKINRSERIKSEKWKEHFYTWTQWIEHFCDDRRDRDPSPTRIWRKMWVKSNMILKQYGQGKKMSQYECIKFAHVSVKFSWLITIDFISNSSNHLHISTHKSYLFFHLFNVNFTKWNKYW